MITKEFMRKTCSSFNDGKCGNNPYHCCVYCELVLSCIRKWKKGKAGDGKCPKFPKRFFTWCDRMVDLEETLARVGEKVIFT